MKLGYTIQSRDFEISARLLIVLSSSLLIAELCRERVETITTLFSTIHDAPGFQEFWECFGKESTLKLAVEHMCKSILWLKTKLETAGLRIDDSISDL
jgi:hypothetical protein